MSLVRFINRQMQDEIASLQKQIDLAVARSEKAGTAFTLRIYDTLAEAPLAAEGMVEFAVGFVKDGRKTGEGAGNGTGIPAYFNPPTNTWKTFYDDSDVVI